MGRLATQTRLSPSRNDLPKLLTAEELAAVLKLNPQTLYRLARQGVIPAIRIGKKSLRFDPIKVRESLDAQGTFRTRVRSGRPPAGPFAFTKLEDLLAENRWTTPSPDLVLDRFTVEFPPATDLRDLAYERTRP